MGARLLQDRRAGRTATGTSPAFAINTKKGRRSRAPASDSEERAGLPPPATSTEGRHLSFGRLAIERSARVLDRPVEGLPDLADNLFVGRHRTLGCHAQRVGLYTHVGCKLPLALGAAVIADRTVEILVAGIIGSLGGCIARLGDSPAVELSGAMRRSDEGSDDALEVERPAPTAPKC